jgi:hypothetical protein
MKTLILLFLFMNTVPACKQEPEAFAKGKDLPEKTMLNVSYGTDSLQTMDVYLPANRSAEKTKSLILVHGGDGLAGARLILQLTLTASKRVCPTTPFST